MCKVSVRCHSLRIFCNSFCKLQKKPRVPCINYSQIHECIEIGNEATQFHFWENLFRIFGTLCLQCTSITKGQKDKGELNREDLTVKEAHVPSTLCSL
jgi:hypothetical protein